MYFSGWGKFLCLDIISGYDIRIKESTVVLILGELTASLTCPNLTLKYRSSIAVVYVRNHTNLHLCKEPLV